MKKNNNTFFDRVYEVVLKIPKGNVTNYGAIADYLGTGLSARMVGWAMNAAHTSTPKIPAHRVVNRNGMLTGKHHFSTPTLMQDLLEAEGMEIVDDEIQNFKKHFWDPSTELGSKNSAKKKLSSLPKLKKGHRLR
ncbi:MAG: MGMT family protein [Chitinophagales bacterium]|nr:MGMT family protein [Chitinophagales bacterium]